MNKNKRKHLKYKRSAHQSTCVPWLTVMLFFGFAVLNSRLSMLLAFSAFLIMFYMPSKNLSIYQCPIPLAIQFMSPTESIHHSTIIFNSMRIDIIFRYSYLINIGIERAITDISSNTYTHTQTPRLHWEWAAIWPYCEYCFDRCQFCPISNNFCYTTFLNNLMHEYWNDVLWLCCIFHRSHWACHLLFLEIMLWVVDM